MDVMEAKKALLDHYEKEYAELGFLVTRLRRELGVGDAGIKVTTSQDSTANGGPTATSVADAVRPGDFFGMTQVQAVRTFLERMHTAASLQDIAAALYRGKATDRLIEGAAALRNLSSVLSRSDDFVSVARGRWGLSEWYPAGKVRRARRSREEQPDSAVEPEVGDE